MQTIIMTVGTSLLTNRDLDLPEERRRPWAGRREVPAEDVVLAWMAETDLEAVSAETNTLSRLEPGMDDVLHLLHSDTAEGLACAELLKTWFVRLGQAHVHLHRVPGISYEVEQMPPALTRFARLVDRLLDEAERQRATPVTLAATGGFKSEVMMMAIVGNARGVPVAYVHERFRHLIYLPLPFHAQGEAMLAPAHRASLPDSGVARDAVLQVSTMEHHRPRLWKKVARMLRTVPWIDRVVYRDEAYAAPRNGLKTAPHRTEDGRVVLWLHLADDRAKMAVSVETTGHTSEHAASAAGELRERLGRML